MLEESSKLQQKAILAASHEAAILQQVVCMYVWISLSLSLARSLALSLSLYDNVTDISRVFDIYLCI
jgi:hypothetical protein